MLIGAQRLPMGAGADLSLRGQARILDAVASLRAPFARSLPFTLGPMSSAPLGRALVKRWTAQALHSRGVRRDLRKYSTASDYAALDDACRRLVSFDRPAVVLWSRRDRMMPFAHAGRLAEILPQSRLVPLEHGGTLLQIDHPAQVGEQINGIAIG